MRLLIHPHALIHGINETQIRAAFETGSAEARIRRRDSGADPPRWGMIGFDSTARAIELVVVELTDGNVLAIHSNYLTEGFMREMRKAR